MSCTECKYAPKTYEEYCMAQSGLSDYCRDAYTIKALYYCNMYHKLEQKNIQNERKDEKMIDNKEVFRFKKMLNKSDSEKFQEFIDSYYQLINKYADLENDYIRLKNELKGIKETPNITRLVAVKEERKDYEFNLVEEKKVAELAILNDTLALIYDYISEKK